MVVPARCILEIRLLKKARAYFRGPFFSSWLRTEAASFLDSLSVGFLLPLRTLLASEDVLLPDCFVVISHILFCDGRQDMTRFAADKVGIGKPFPPKEKYQSFSAMASQKICAQLR